MSIFAGDIESDNSDNSSSFIDVSLNHTAIGNLRAGIIDKADIVEYSEPLIIGTSVFMASILFIGVCWKFCSPHHQGYVSIPEIETNNGMPHNAIPVNRGLYLVPR